VSILCLLGCLNTFCGEFQRVAQFHEDRDEVFPLENLSLTADANRLAITFAFAFAFALALELACVFSITRENFLQLLEISQRSGMFRVAYARSDFMATVPTATTAVFACSRRSGAASSSRSGTWVLRSCTRRLVVAISRFCIRALHW
jgi:hypothetical protein